MSLDVGLARRISASITFGVPQVEERERLWRGLVSPRVPPGGDVDFTELAARFALTGGHIRTWLSRPAERPAPTDPTPA
jgi:hypothetical protein